MDTHRGGRHRWTESTQGIRTQQQCVACYYRHRILAGTGEIPAKGTKRKDFASTNPRKWHDRTRQLVHTELARGDDDCR